MNGDRVDVRDANAGTGQYDSRRGGRMGPSGENGPDAEAPEVRTEAALRLRKLELEVAEMERDALPASRRIRGIGSTLGVGGALLTLLVGIVEFGQREAERLNQQAVQIEDAQREAEAARSAAFREAFGEISALSSAAPAIPRTRYLLVSLTQLREGCPASSDCAWEDRMVTEQLAYIATRELSYIDGRGASDLDLTFLDLWASYEGWLRANPDKNKVILYKEFQGLRKLAARYPEYFAGLRFAEQDFLMDTYSQEEEQFLHFSSLTRSYRRHRELLPDEGDRRLAALQYAAALNNPTLAESLFGYPEGDLANELSQVPVGAPSYDDPEAMREGQPTPVERAPVHAAPARARR